MLDKRFIDFWDWFAKHSNHLHSDTYDTTLLSKLDETISSWGFTWEIGAGSTKENSLTISPNGDKELLEQTTKIIDGAPKLDDWEFYSSKQQKDNWDKAEFDGIKVDASEWTYVLLKYPDDKYEILIQADNLKQLDTPAKELAVDLVLTNLLGEKTKIEEIVLVDIVDKHENENRTAQLKFLPAHIDRLKNST